MRMMMQWIQQTARAVPHMGQVLVFFQAAAPGEAQAGAVGALVWFIRTGELAIYLSGILIEAIHLVCKQISVLKAAILTEVF
jgi:hypothetical protein